MMWPWAADLIPRGVLSLTLVAVSALVAGCHGNRILQPDPGGDAANGDAPGDPVTPVDSRYRTRLLVPPDFAALQGETQGEVKYLFRVDGRQVQPPLTEPCYFQDMHQFDWHILFLWSFPELAAMTLDDYDNWVLIEATRVWWGGGIQIWPAVRHPGTGALGIMSYTVYADADPRGNLTAADVVEVDGRIKSCAPFVAALLAFVPADAQQENLVLTERALLSDNGVAVVMSDELVPGIASQSYSVGEGYGTLRVVPSAEHPSDYSVRDVVVTQGAPNNLSVVAGLVTAEAQDSQSALAVRLQHRALPNAAVISIYDNAYVSALEHWLVHVVVAADAITLEPARLEDAETYWLTHRPPMTPAAADLSVSALADLSALAADDAPAYGIKAANLAELYPLLQPANRPTGFAVPFARYRTFAVASGVDGLVAAALADPQVRLSATVKDAALAAIRDRIVGAPLDPTLLAEVRQSILTSFGAGAASLPLRLQSSADLEDFEASTSADLYAPQGGYSTVDLQDEGRLAQAVLGVWAELWTARAFDARDYYGMNQSDAVMGIIVSPAALMEQANAVAITNLLLDAGDPVYRVVSQPGDASVTRPVDPTATAEIVTFRRTGTPPAPTELVWLVTSSLLPPGVHVWSDQDLMTLADLLFLVQDQFASAVYPGIAPLQLAIEVARTGEGNIVLSAVRPYVGSSP
jgi:pyruvate, water dikinase